MSLLNRWKLTQDFILRKKTISVGPPEVIVEITNRCNLNCKMCPRLSMKRAQGDMSLDLFTKIIKEITVAARIGGGDAESNPRLRTALTAAKSANMPSKNIDNAIKKGTGELPGVVYEDVAYEGYGPGGVALYIEAVTDNRNRTVAEIRHILSKNNGNLGESGSVAWMFEKKGLIQIPVSCCSEDEMMEIALESGAEDIKTEDDF